MMSATMTPDRFDILADDFNVEDIIKTAAFLVMALLAGLGSMFKKKAQQGGKPVIPQSDDEETSPQPPPARRATPSMGAPGSPNLGYGQPPPTPPRPRPLQPIRPQMQPASRQPQTPIRPLRPPAASPPIMRPTPITQPQPPRRVTLSQHAAQLAAHAEEIARRLAEAKRIPSEQPLTARMSPTLERVGRPARAESPPPGPRKRHRLLSNLNPANLKQAVVLSEILSPPLATREQG